MIAEYPDYLSEKCEDMTEIQKGNSESNFTTGYAELSALARIRLPKRIEFVIGPERMRNCLPFPGVSRD
jgi:hypothetical protein